MAGAARTDLLAGALVQKRLYDSPATTKPSAVSEPPNRDRIMSPSSDETDPSAWLVLGMSCGRSPGGGHCLWRVDEEALVENLGSVVAHHLGEVPHVGLVPLGKRLRLSCLRSTRNVFYLQVYEHLLLLA